MNIIVSHPTGNANVRAVVTGFAQANALETFFTSVAYFEKSAWLKFLIKDVARREFGNDVRPFTQTHPWKEIARHISNRLGLYAFTANEKDIFSVDSVYKDFDRHVAQKINSLQNNPVIYGYEDGSCSSFRTAKQKGFTCVYDLPIVYWETARRLLEEEAMRLPAWKKTLGGGITDSEEKLARKHEELLMADLVITPSGFVADSVAAAIAGKKVIVAAFGTPASDDNGNSPGKKTGPLKVLFTGSMGQRKGLADLAEAVKLLKTKNIELVILGSRLEERSFYAKELPPHIYEPPRPHQEVLELMSTCDILCLPSIVEGRALVMQEAMSRGLPVIITPNTGGEDLVLEGKTGFLVPIRSPEAIAEKINWFCEHRNLVNDMGFAAKQHAAKYTWEAYVNNILNAIRLMVD